MMVTAYNVLRMAKEANVYSDAPMYSRKGASRILKSDVQFRLSNGKILSIQAGMYWDENSIPYIFQWAFPKSGKYAVPALVHDALYFDTSTSQRFADDEFKYWMRAVGCSKQQIWFRYWAVRLFGGSYWRKNKNSPRVRCLHNRELIKIN
jgi:hypothetical protein